MDFEQFDEVRTTLSRGQVIKYLLEVYNLLMNTVNVSCGTRQTLLVPGPSELV